LNGIIMSKGFTPEYKVVAINDPSGPHVTAITVETLDNDPCPLRQRRCCRVLLRLAVLITVAGVALSFLCCHNNDGHNSVGMRGFIHKMHHSNGSNMNKDHDLYHKEDHYHHHHGWGNSHKHHHESGDGMNHHHHGEEDHHHESGNRMNHHHDGEEDHHHPPPPPPFPGHDGHHPPPLPGHKTDLHPHPHPPPPPFGPDNHQYIYLPPPDDLLAPEHEYDDQHQSHNTEKELPQVAEVDPKETELDESIEENVEEDYYEE
jgi:hypothetical protein